MADFPALPLWTDAYIADTAHLTNEEHGVYLRLLMFAWRSPACALPDDDKRLALMVGVSVKKWQSIRPVIEPMWSVQEGKWTQKRLTAERDFVQRQSKAGRTAAEARWKGKSLTTNENSDAAASETHMRKGCETDAPTPTPIPTVGVEVLRPSTPKEEEEGARLLLLKIAEAVGFERWEMTGPYWNTPSAIGHVKRWLDDGLTADEIVEAAEASRHKHPEPPDGPKGLDRFMAAAATAKRSGTKTSRAEKAPTAAPTEEQLAAQDKRLADWVKAGTCPASVIRPDRAREMLSKKLVTTDELRGCGITW